ncbi:MAG: iron ABC transporter permease [Anaeromicrobium sp.]|jgi:iron complex transport system permease protein|uniref:FecCD family ABC transporter permease n=1 Tax=Anaeromicrobium sp. TaxID=1929132 RepID=UPI0025CF8764|nr:iron ABC transporter permease [Anaeromicrobium sp.]MCT4595664.1 iron ABC transporter permease [Anaeromicrobium sp.]
MKESLINELKSKNRGKKIVAVFIFILLIVTLILCVNLGRAEISHGHVIKVIGGKIFKNPEMYSGIKNSYVKIIWNVRLPRILTAIIVGAGLAVSGTVFQSLLMNPLADSYTMGVSSGAALGATLAIYINLFYDIYVPITISSFIGAFVTLIIVIFIARTKGYISGSNLIIAGIIVSSIFSAGIKFIKSLAGENVSAIVNWLMGSLAARSWVHVQIGFFTISISIIICWYYAKDLNLLCLGEREAKSLGIDTKRVKKIFLICGSLITAVCVSISGIIGFVGLIVPHMLRFTIGSDNRMLIPLSALLGGELLLLADTGSRALMNVEIPVGVLTTLLGGPFFIYIFITRNKSLN